MMRLTPELPYLDEAGHVYVPLAGPEGACLKLNRHASQVWRAALSGPVDLDALAAADRDFLRAFVGQGVLLAATADERY
ncbi:hypothetical protein ACFO3J_08155 [Streptomyces polygonati]|uniref:PqqD family protein n=1 Tax=Streptomyces polygonati TaxID=1617087 RepID=A0ABV8HKW1_9ACTN